LKWAKNKRLAEGGMEMGRNVMIEGWREKDKRTREEGMGVTEG